MHGRGLLVEFRIGTSSGRGAIEMNTKSGSWVITALVMYVLVMTLPHIALALVESQTVEIDRITWRYTVTGGKNAHLIWAAPAEDKPGVPQVNPKTVTIPSSFPSNCTLTSIGSNAFAATQYWNWTNMVEVTIPKGVTSIGDKAFYCCYNLRRVSMPDTVRSIGASAFENCALTTSIHLPQQLTTIGERAFAMCLYLDYLYIPVNVETIGENAFYSIHMEKLFAPTTWSNRAPFQSTGMASGCDIRYVLTAQVVTFNANGGNCSTQSFTYTSDLPYGILPDATRSEYAFAGWWTSPSGPGIQVTESNTVSHAETLMLYARWTPTKQVVYFNANGGNCSTTSQTYAVGAKYGTFPEATREDYTFQGWWTEQNGGVLIATTNIAPAEETRTLYAHWNPLKQSVTFDSNGGTCDTDSRIYSVGGTYSPLPDASRENYTFMGWWTSSSGGEQVLETERVTVEESRILYAHWSLAYQTVSFDANGGECSTASRRYPVGEVYDSFPVATREHFSFGGWWTLPSGGERLGNTSVVSAQENRTLYAQWTRKDLLVTFAPNGGSCNVPFLFYPIGFAYGQLPEATWDGYSFDGWFTQQVGGEAITKTTTVPEAEEQTLWAHWIPTGQIVEFFANGGECDTTNFGYTVGVPYGWLPTPTRDGFAFSGWYPMEERTRISENTIVSTEGRRWLYASWNDHPIEEAEIVALSTEKEAGSLSFVFCALSNKTYVLQRTPSLASTSAWTTVEKIEFDRTGAFKKTISPPARWENGFFRIREYDSDSPGGLYIVVDMSGGVNAERWPVSSLESVPDDGWSDQYKTTHLLLRFVPAGTFTMGSPDGELGRYTNEIQHKVTLTKSYYMGVFEVTQAQWELAMGKRPSYFDNSEYYASRPVESVSYNDIRGTLSWPSTDRVEAGSFFAVLRSKTGLAFDLPTEAQWEYACRAGTTNALNSGKELTSDSICSNMAAVGRYSLKSYSQYASTGMGTAKVGSYLPNAWGIYDMHGNVWEWCLDYYGKYPTSDRNDPPGPYSGDKRVERGGSWYCSAKNCRAAVRFDYSPTYRNSDTGFRVCCPAGQP